MKVIVFGKSNRPVEMINFNKILQYGIYLNRRIQEQFKKTKITSDHALKFLLETNGQSTSL